MVGGLRLEGRLFRSIGREFFCVCYGKWELGIGEIDNFISRNLYCTDTALGASVFSVELHVCRGCVVEERTWTLFVSSTFLYKP